MKVILSVIIAGVLSAGAVYADTAMTQDKNALQNEVQNRLHGMSTDELLEKRGTMATQQERDALHNELMNRQSTMNAEQKEKMMKRPENRTPKMKNQSQGQGMMKGNRNGMNGGMGMGKGN